ncbi:lipoprotein [Spiroplasma phoeniceum]|uniref:Spiroplasma plectrovirus-related protein n=1 Tax=Spiroplasma phoeniceum P40 TaxID=1276259 RepID=A0A345DNX0_9MOLU|nr:lipoprotein [Spiroplasma phoeniceum]AXF95908.1 spiroplasma plectrovirus-related protein [Spiroplasma phoeniceum P40]
MKKWLSIIGAIGLTATSTTTLISCKKENNNENGGGDNKPEPQYNSQQPPEGSNWKLIDYPTSKNKVHDLFKNPDNKWYIVIVSSNGEKVIRKFKFTTNTKLVNNGVYKGLPTELVGYYRYIYCWDGVGEPQIPTIDKNTGEITDWKEQKGTE